MAAVMSRQLGWIFSMISKAGVQTLAANKLPTTLQVIMIADMLKSLMAKELVIVQIQTTINQNFERKARPDPIFIRVLPVAYVGGKKLQARPCTDEFELSPT